MNISRSIYLRWINIVDKIFKKCRRNNLNNKDFSIISNNCWAGYVYRRYGIPYLTPTVGLYFFAEDYVKFCNDLKAYIELPLEFIPYTASRYRDIIEKLDQQNVPIARLGDVEIIFLHYKTEEEAREKWERRARRINYDNLIFKFSMMNCCTEEHLRAFDALECDKKFCFVPPEYKDKIKCAVPFLSSKGDTEVRNDSAEYSRYINIEKLINSKYVNGAQMAQKKEI